ncbi:MAG: glycosyltransferase family 4 protein [Proteobacteria bacterium]|nr:glycosyltransferase family 4 protein [Pseudomonadota bacterium]
MVANTSHTIYFIIRYFYPFVGGLEKKTLNLAASLVRRGHRVIVMTSRFSKSWPRQDSLLCVPVVRLASPNIKYAGACVFLMALSWHLWRQRKHCGLLHAFQVGYTSGCAIFLGRMLGKPTVLTLASSGSGGDIQRHVRTVWGRAFLGLCRRASRVVILNQTMIQELKGIGYGDAGIALVGNGVDMLVYKKAEDRVRIRAQLGFGENEKLILYAGRLSSEKGVDFLVRSCACLNVSGQTKLLIVGDGPEKTKLQELARTVGLGSKVLWCGSVDDVVDYLQAADLFVMPSQFEGQSNAILEAMACELPVIATDVAGNNELVSHGDNGLLIAYGDESALAAAICFLLENPQQAQELAARAHTCVRERHNLQDVIVRYEALYDCLQTRREKSV